ncbi:MAG: LacI family DNA-binding transcriptional regulator [Anaerolineae bacterium]|nr:LacI family DNA-binding transcriptional regulator [Anaerolineae bacterium]
MATLKNVADLAQVPMLVAYAALTDDPSVDDATRKRVARCAQQLKFRLRITQVDVADLAGVAKGTVSYALNDSDLISEATRQKVRQAAAALNYRRNTAARNLRTNHAGVIGYSWHIADDPSAMNSLLDRFIYRVTTRAENAGYHLLTFIQPQQNAAKIYDELISTNRVDGFIISDVRYHDPRLARLSAIGAPCVAFGGMYSENADFAYVDVDGKYGIGLAVDHLLERGHERIGLLGYEPGRMIGDAREAGYRAAMRAAGIRVEPDWVAYTPNILQRASTATRRLLAAKHPPTAIICANDVMAFGAKTYFDAVDLVPGRDIALTGYDDDPTSEFLGITSLRQPIDALAATVIDILLGEIGGKPCPERQVVLLPELIVRRSTAG